jgi:hypothetical protein
LLQTDFAKYDFLLANTRKGAGALAMLRQSQLLHLKTINKGVLISLNEPF